ncbi:MAG: hypothetical protein Q4B64_09095 [Spirochaetales bacterium]|nr:hypothetical protein [Spirochaetales bacterium]
MEENKKKNKPFPLKLLSGVLIVIITLVALLGIWIVYSAFDRTSTLKFIPENYTAIIHTDKIYSAVEPLVGLKAAETILSDPSLSEAREPYMKTRAFINNASPLITRLINRRLDTALYLDGTPGFVAVADIGWLSCATRLSSVAAGFLHVKNLFWSNGHFEYKSGEATIYAKPYKNLVMISSSKELFELSEQIFDSRIITDSEKKEVEGKKISTLKILAPSMKIAQMKPFEKIYSENAEKILGKDNLSSITFDITNEMINVELNVPVNKEECNTDLSAFLKSKSTQPKLPSFLTSDTQYYTLINLAPLKEMKEAFFPVLQKTTDIEGTWRKADSLSRSFFSLTLEDLLFSWTGNEIAAFGIEGSSDPVFVVQIKDEAKRAEVFDKLDDSILLNTNTSLIVNGMRLPCLELPGFISGLLSVFNVNLPRPFYLVNKGYMYFSMSPQNLSSVFTHINKNYIISRNSNWRNVSAYANPNTSLELYYNLKRSLPFFLDNASLSAKILKLYGIGRFDFEITKDSIQASLYATAGTQEDSHMLAGFPKQTGKISDYNLISDNDEDPENLYWIEDETKLKCLNLNSLEQKEMDDFEGKIYIASTKGKAGKNNRLWVSTERGDIYLVDNNFKIAKEIHTDTIFTAGGAAYRDSYAVPTKDGNILFADSKGNTEEVFIGPDLNIKGRPSVCDEYIAVYSRGFEGEIYLLKNKECINRDNPMIVDGIGFGSPAIAKINERVIVGFLTQKGEFYLFEDGILAEGFPIETGKVFNANVVFGKNAFYSLSQDAVIYRFNLNRTYSCVKIPDIQSAKESYICSKVHEGSEGIYASGDSNIIYGFSPELELLMSFPLAGRGVPVFADVNKDKNTNCLVLSISREINSWRIK